MTKFPKFLAVLTLAAMLVACGESKKRGMYVDYFRFGDTVAADGIVVRETDVIPPGSTAAVSLYVRNVPSETQVRLVWSDAAGKAATAADVKAVGAKGLVTFKQPKPLPEGNYRVDMYYKEPNGTGWNNLGTHAFTVGSKR
jgi:hypothetical protein